jgi:drug/metabolite transporter (DMT)-like permease
LDIVVFGAMLASAFLHAVWNAWVKSRRDSNAAIAALVIGAGIPNIAVIAALGWPAAPAWPWIACTVALSIGALTLLGAAYREGDFAVAFPMIRGLIPVVLVVAAVPLFAEAPTLFGTLGVACVSAGLLLIGWEAARRHAHRDPEGSRTHCARGGRHGGIGADRCQGLAARRQPPRLCGHHRVPQRRRHGGAAGPARAPGRPHAGAEWPITIFAALVSIVSYQLYIWSLQQAPVALVSAMRETSMLFALLIALVILRERFGLWRWLAVGLMLGGLALMRL